ncbi:MAG: competence/damage-inducible protein A [Candidatus Marinimicrobia bacterium]|nr:competence/damage-inducible protein A [Candidatus Neomarinimicrobiota bacterium]
MVMKTGIITVGNELLTGFIDDTNASWLGRALTAIGLPPVWHLTVSDNREEIKSALATIPTNITDVIITGGLGPTPDDITMKTVADFYGFDLEYDEKYWKSLAQRFKRSGRTIPEINKNQAFVLVGPEIIPNPVGSARGALINQNNQRLYILPGVPIEMKAMYTATILPLIKPENVVAKVSVLRTTGIMESALAEKLVNINSNFPTVTMAYLPRITGVDIRLIGNDQVEIEGFKLEVERIAGDYIYGYEDTELEDVVGELLTKEKLTIATAESCTGGLVSHRLTQTPGSSDYFMGSIVAYSNNIKMNLLDVQESTLLKYGAVSEETVVEMAIGARTRLGTDIGIATTGIAGPGGGTPEKPVGLVYIGLATEKRVKTRKFIFHFNRQLNKLLTSQVALNMIRLELKNA